MTPTDLPRTEPADGEDAHMQSSPFMSSSMLQQEDEEEHLAVKTVTLCREEDLEGEKIFNLSLCPVPEHSQDRCISQKIRGQSEGYRKSICSCIQLGTQHHTGKVVSNEKNTANLSRIFKSCPTVIE